MDNEDLAQQLLDEYNKSIEELENNDDDGSGENETARLDINHNSNGRRYIYSWIEGLRTDSRLVWVPEEENLYYTNAINKKSNTIACTCFEDDCNARIVLINDDTASKVPNAGIHTHGSLYHVYKERKLFAWMKETCRTAPASATIRDIYNQAVVQ